MVVIVVGVVVAAAVGRVGAGENVGRGDGCRVKCGLK